MTSEIAIRMREERSRLGLTQDQLGTKMGLNSGSIISRWENGLRAPGAESLRMLYELGFDVQYVLTGNRAVDKVDQMA